MFYKNILLSDGNIHIRSVFIRYIGNEQYYQFDTAQKPSSNQDILSLIFHHLRTITANLFDFESEFNPILDNPTIKVTLVNEGFYHYKFIPKFNDPEFTYDYDSLSDEFNKNVLKTLIYDKEIDRSFYRKEKYALLRYLEIHKYDFNANSYDFLFDSIKKSLNDRNNIIEIGLRVRNENSLLTNNEKFILSMLIESSRFLKFDRFVSKDGEIPDWEDFVLNELGEVHAYKPITYKGEEFRICGSFKN